MRARRVFLVLAAALGFVPGASASGSDHDTACEVRTFEGDSFTVCTFDAWHHELRLMSRDAKGKPLRGFPKVALALGTDAQRLRFVMNAGMFEKDGSAVGLLVEGGEERRALNASDGDGNFFLKPNGVFSVDSYETVRIETAEAYAARKPNSTWATQSGPMLVTGGKFHPQITADGPSKTIRNGVGVRDDHTALFVISDGPVSFGRLARFFRDELKCEDALYLDGTISSLWWPAKSQRVNGMNIGPMAVVLDKPYR